EARLQQVKGPLPVDAILRIGREIAEGLAAAHGHGLIHRDIKPANVWLETMAAATDKPQAERVKILDFGLACAIQGEEPGGAEPGTIQGTPSYMAPEQARGQAGDARADLFSLGCVLYRMATGRPAFQGADLICILMSVATEEPPPPQELNPELPPA